MTKEINEQRGNGFSPLPWLLAAGLSASTWTQLRLPGAPIGVGEALLAAWLVLAVLKGAYIGFVPVPNRTGALDITVWVAILCSIYFGFILATVTGTIGGGEPVKEFAAFYFSAALCIVFCIQPDATRQAEALLRAYGACMIASMTFQLLGALYGARIGVKVWYDSFRFQGFSENPNQLALSLLPVPLIAMYRLMSRERRGLLVSVLSTLLALVVGLLSDSDALVLAWVAGVLFLMVHWVVQTIAGVRRNRKLLATALVCGPALLIVAIGLFWTEIAEVAEQYVSGTIDNGNQAGARISLWANAVVAASKTLLGLGPGTFSGVLRPFDGWEAHNSFLDLLVNGGVLATVVLLLWLGRLVWLLVSSGEYQLGVLMLSLAVFAAFHNVLRQPVFWVFLFCGAARAAARPVAGRAVSLPR